MNLNYYFACRRKDVQSPLFYHESWQNDICSFRDMTKGVASMRQDEAIASSCFRRRQIFAHLFQDKANINFN